MDVLGCDMADEVAVSAADAGAERPVKAAQIPIDAVRTKRAFVVVTFVMKFLAMLIVMCGKQQNSQST
jgi:hypothetical protein